MRFLLARMDCVSCGARKSEDAFSLRGTQRRICKKCTNEKLAKYRGRDDPLKRILYNAKNRCRLRRKKEALFWNYDAVRDLVGTLDSSDADRIWIVHIDRDQPFAPQNCRAELHSFVEGGKRKKRRTIRESSSPSSSIPDLPSPVPLPTTTTPKDLFDGLDRLLGKFKRNDDIVSESRDTAGEEGVANE